MMYWNWSGMGMGLLDINSCAIGLFSEIMLVIKEDCADDNQNPSDNGYGCGSFVHKTCLAPNRWRVSSERSPEGDKRVRCTRMLGRPCRWPSITKQITK